MECGCEVKEETVVSGMSAEIVVSEEQFVDKREMSISYAEEVQINPFGAQHAHAPISFQLSSCNNARKKSSGKSSMSMTTI